MTQYAHIVLSWLILSCYLCHSSLGNSDKNTVKCSDTERKALLQFKDGITNDFCGLLTSWRDDIECCQWRGVQCSNTTSRVIIIHLQGSNYDTACLVGNLSSSLGKLKYLTHLNLNFNHFYHPNLDFLGSLLNLEHLNLGECIYNVETSPHGNNLQWLSRLRLLRHLDLSHADLSDAKNWTQIVNQLPFLTVLRMDFCQLPDVNIPATLIHVNSSSKLRVISLSYNNFNDRSIFQWLFNLPRISTRLKYLDLSSNSLEGSIPKGLGKLQHLSHIDLSENQLEGPAPKDLGNLQHLSHLDLSNNRLEGPILKELGNLQQLLHLDLSYNHLEGPILKGLGNLQQLSHLDLSWNHLKGPVPKGFGKMHHLSHIDLSNNQLEGPIPSEFRSMHSLSYLSLSKNNLQGSVFENLCNLQELYLGTNNFTNELTSVIQALLSCGNTKLQILDLSQNHLWGEIPDTISSFSMLRELYLDGNQLNGEIPQVIGQLSMLEKLYLSSNSLNATLTHTFFLNLLRLRELDLSDNTRIVMNIDASWDPPFQLKIIRLRSCKLGPYFPNWVKKQTKFLYLDVSNAEISDKIPISFWNSLPSYLWYLNMSYNQISGSIPNLPQTVDFLSLNEVDLSTNLFEGAVPSWFTNASILFLNNNRFSDSSYMLCPKTTSSLYEIDLSNNFLSRELPECWMNFDQLSSLHLENNRFSGKLPKSIGTLKNLRYLHLNNNSFSGPIPASLKNCTYLKIINLGHNSFTGNIPPWIGSVHSLGALILRGNNFLGEIPTSMCQLSQLQILDLAMNHISGVIPRCVYNFTAMMGDTYSRLASSSGSSHLGHTDTLDRVENTILTWKKEDQKFKQSVRFVKSIDLSFNNLGGEIPDGIYNLAGLLSLDLSKNNLSGSIAPKIGQLTSLELLDLSDNHLTGEIPGSLAKLSFLEILDLSNNNLSGEIPVGTQLQSFNASSYTGNPGLCGAPLYVCLGDQTPVDTFKGDNTSFQDEHPDNGLFPGLYISVVLGLVIGFWGVFGTLVIKNSWRYAWFSLLDSTWDRFYVIAICVVAKAWRKP